MAETESISQARGSDGFRSGMQRVGQDVRKLKDDISELAKDTGAAAQSGIGVAKDGLRHSLESAKEQGTRAVDSLREQVVSNPLASIGIAAGVGFLVGIALFRPRS